MNLKQARAGLSALIHLREGGNTSQWVADLIQQYEEQIARLMLLDEDGLLSYEAIKQIAGTGDTDDDE